MTFTLNRCHRLLGVLISTMLACTAVQAEKPDWAGNGKNDKGGKHEKHDKPGGSQSSNRADLNERKDRDSTRGGGMQIDLRFADDRRVAIHEFYQQQQRSGKCPPGLAKKGNGCLPPGQARKWKHGTPLPREVVIHDLPSELVVRIGVPPAGYRYARVGADILMLAIGTNMVIDAITDLGR